jgi:hypothetical protein
VCSARVNKVGVMGIAVAWAGSDSDRGSRRKVITGSELCASDVWEYEVNGGYGMDDGHVVWWHYWSPLVRD